MAPRSVPRGRMTTIAVLVAGVTAVVTVAPPAFASAKAAARPSVVSYRVSARSVPASGGTVTFTVRVRKTSECSLKVTGHAAVAVTYARAWLSCSGGVFTESVTFGVNSGQGARSFAVRVYLRRRGEIDSSSLGSVHVNASPSRPAPELVTSRSWSGYVVPTAGAVVTDVSGRWTVPRLNCADTPDAGEDTWVGTGGAGWPSGGYSGDLLQTGIQDTCVNGVQQEFGWWEEYPEFPDTFFSDFSVSPGDSIEAFVYKISSDCTTNCGQWETKVEDLTTGLAGFMVTGEGWGVASISSATFPDQGTTADVTYPGATSAEWVVEDYLLNYQAPNGARAAFANYGTVRFSDLLVGGLASWSLASSQRWEMVQNGVALSTPSAPGTDGFLVSYTGP